MSENKGPTVDAVICSVTAASTIFCAARLYTRGRILGKLHLDDYLIFASVIFGWCSTIFGVLAVHNGQGRHTDTLTTDEKSKAILYTMIGFCPGVMSFGIPKLAVVSLLTRLLNPGRLHIIFLWTLTTVTMASLFASIGILFGQCTPSRAQWDFSVTEKTCLSPWVLVHVAMLAGTVILYRLQLKTKKKIALIGALGIGSIAAVVAIYKTTRLPSLASDDFAYDTSDLVMWTTIEGSTIIIAACIPILQPLADRVLGSSFFGSSFDRHDYKKYGTIKTDGAIPNSNIELTSNVRRKPRDPNGLTFLDKEGSEESILHKRSQSRPDQSTSASSGDDIQATNNGIMRTDVVTVTYMEPDKKVNEETDKWKRGF